LPLLVLMLRLLLLLLLPLLRKLACHGLVPGGHPHLMLADQMLAAQLREFLLVLLLLCLLLLSPPQYLRLQASHILCLALLQVCVVLLLPLLLLLVLLPLQQLLRRLHLMPPSWGSQLLGWLHVLLLVPPLQGFQWRMLHCPNRCLPPRGWHKRRRGQRASRCHRRRWPNRRQAIRHL
jgi:hypothetical protein